MAAGGDEKIPAGAGETLQEFLGTDSTRTKGDGELLGVIDTGIWPEHPSFADDGTYRPRELNSKGGTSKCNFGNTKANPDDAKWNCNKKLVGARQMLSTYRAVICLLPGEFDSARDDDGHGTHTASTAAGNADVEAWIYDKDRALDTTWASPPGLRSWPTRRWAPKAASPRTWPRRSTRLFTTASTSSTTPSVVPRAPQRGRHLLPLREPFRGSRGDVRGQRRSRSIDDRWPSRPAVR